MKSMYKINVKCDVICFISFPRERNLGKAQSCPTEAKNKIFFCSSDHSHYLITRQQIKVTKKKIPRR